MVAINKILGFIPPVAWLAATLVFLGMFIGQSWRLDSCNQALGAAKVAVDTAKNVNDNNKVTVADLKDTNAACLDGRRIEEEVFRVATVDWVREQAQLQAAAQVERIREVEIYREPSCVDFAKIDISLVCPDLAMQWRRRILGGPSG